MIGMCALSPRAFGQLATSETDGSRITHFVPNFQRFWDFSKNWTTNYGPAYRDTVLGGTNFLPCTGKYALCFHSGPEPMPCKLTPDGRFANCECPVRTGLNFVLITAILNERVYQETVAVCGADGSACASTPDKAPVCEAIRRGALIPGADVISTYSPDVGPLDTPKLKICPKGPYAGCMTAPCRTTASGKAECSCPIFWGTFQLTNASAQCTLGDDLVWSASYDPRFDKLP
jgi:hypothetical protein